MDPLVHIDEFMARKFPEQQWLVDGIVPASAITMISGSPGTFKTYTILHLAICLASGEKLFHQFATRQSGVLVIDEDNEEWLRHSRLKQLGMSRSLPIYFTPRKGFSLDDETIDNVILSCKTYGIRLVIIDCLARIHSSDENKSGDMSEAFKRLKRFSEKDIAVVITHHNNKKGASDDAGLSGAMRGSSDIFASTDTHLAVTRPSKHLLRFVQTKQRYAEELDPFKVSVETDGKTSFQLDYIGSDGKESRALARLNELQEAVCVLLKEKGKLFQVQLLTNLKHEGVKTNEHELREVLAGMITGGKIVESRGSGKTKFYSLQEVAADE